MFDPERDEVPAASAFYVRIAILVGFGLVFALVLWPSVSTFTAPGPNNEQCVAALDVWASGSASAHDAACRAASRTRVVVSGGGALVVVASATAVAAGMRHDRRRREGLAAPSAG